MDVIAHRGFAEEGVENALSTLAAAVPEADAVEFDVRVSADGVPVVFHDETVDRLTDRSGPVDGYAVAELEAVVLRGTDEAIPRLATVLDRLSGPINPELKVPDGLDRVVDLLSAYDDRVLVSTFRPAVLESVPADLGRAILAAPARPGGGGLPPGAVTSIPEAVDLVSRLGGEAVHPHVSLCAREAVAAAQSAGLAVNAWTVRSRQVGDAMAAAGVDGVVADSPAYASGR